MTTSEGEEDDAPHPPPADGKNRHEVVRRANVELVFQGIVDHAPVSRSTLVDLTGLSKPTVLRLVAALEGEGLIQRAAAAERARPGAGRTPIRYEPNPRAAYVVGIDVGGTKTMVALADLTGTVVAEATASTTPAGGEALVAQLVDLVRELAQQAGVPWARVASVTVGTPGVENPDGTIRLAANIAGLDTVPVADRLRQALQISVQLENDVNLAALGELEGGAARSCQTFALLAVGTGLGLGLVIDGRLARGSRGAGGEVAYLPIGPDPATPQARRHGSFELAASGRGLTLSLAAELDRLLTQHGSTPATRLHPTSTARDIYRAAAENDPLAWTVIGRQAQLVARAILTIACLIDPELVVLSGGIGANPLLLEPVRAALDRIMPWPLTVVSASLGPRSGVVGAVHHALRTVPRLEAATVSARVRTRDGQVRS